VVAYPSPEYGLSGGGPTISVICEDRTVVRPTGLSYLDAITHFTHPSTGRSLLILAPTVRFGGSGNVRVLDGDSFETVHDLVGGETEKICSLFGFEDPAGPRLVVGRAQGQIEVR
jgi:hypothetical protein